MAPRISTKASHDTRKKYGEGSSRNNLVNGNYLNDNYPSVELSSQEEYLQSLDLNGFNARAMGVINSEPGLGGFAGNDPDIGSIAIGESIDISSEPPIEAVNDKRKTPSGIQTSKMSRNQIKSVVDQRTSSTNRNIANSPQGRSKSVRGVSNTGLRRGKNELRTGNTGAGNTGAGNTSLGTPVIESRDRVTGSSRDTVRRSGVSSRGDTSPRAVVRRRGNRGRAGIRDRNTAPKLDRPSRRTTRNKLDSNRNNRRRETRRDYKEENLSLPTRIEFPEVSITAEALERAIGQIDQYVLLKRLGQGGMGQVYLAMHKDLKTVCVIKTILRKHSSAQAKQRFLKEAQITAQVTTKLPKNSGIVNVVDYGHSREHGDYLVMNYVEGLSLGEIRKELEANNEIVPDITAINWLLDASKAVSHLHSKENRIIHRDIKPDNIMLSKKGQIVICDLGLAKKVSKRGEEEELYADKLVITDNKEELSLTQGGIVGTIGYASPEQIDKKYRKHMDTRSDIYSLGATFYTLLTGERVYQSENIMGMMMQVTDMKKRPKAIHRYNANIHPELERVINKMMEKRVSKRYQNIEEVIKDLEDLKLKMETGVLEYYYKKNPKLVLSVVGGIVLAVSVGVTAVLGRGQEKAQTLQEQAEIYANDGDKLYRAGMSIAVYPPRDLKEADMRKRVELLKKSVELYNKSRRFDSKQKEKYDKAYVQWKLSEAMVPIAKYESSDKNYEGKAKDLFKWYDEINKEVKVSVEIFKELEIKYPEIFKSDKNILFYFFHSLYLKMKSIKIKALLYNHIYKTADVTNLYHERDTSVKSFYNYYEKYKEIIGKIEPQKRINIEQLYAMICFYMSKIYELKLGEKQESMEMIKRSSISCSKAIQLFEKWGGRVNSMQTMNMSILYVRSANNLREINKDQKYTKKIKKYLLKGVMYDAYACKYLKETYNEGQINKLYNSYIDDIDKFNLILKAVLKINPKQLEAKKYLKKYPANRTISDREVDRFIEDFKRENPNYNCSKR